MTVGRLPKWRWMKCPRRWSAEERNVVVAMFVAVVASMDRCYETDPCIRILFRLTSFLHCSLFHFHSLRMQRSFCTHFAHLFWSLNDGRQRKRATICAVNASRAIKMSAKTQPITQTNIEPKPSMRVAQHTLAYLGTVPTFIYSLSKFTFLFFYFNAFHFEY